MGHEHLSVQQLDELTPNLDSALSMLVSRARQGDSSAREDIIGQCRNYLLLIANEELDQQLHAKCAPSDVVQNSLIAAVEHFDDFRGDNRQTLLAWLRQILVNEIQDARRKFLQAEKRDVRREQLASSLTKHGRQQAALADPHLTPSSEAAAQDEALRLRKALSNLPNDYRQVLLLRNWERLSFQEIGETMDRSADAAKKLWARALVRMKDELKER
jgi:RNA polymerase sigma-70 factor (subfamily 1)